jgi:hypothetical protein
MATYLTQEVLQLYAPIVINDYNSVKFDPFVNWGIRAILRQLPKTMQPVIKAQDFTSKPELQAFWLEHLQPWLAMQVYKEMMVANGANLGPDGVRTVTEQYSLEANEKQRSNMLNELQTELNRYRQDAFTVWYDKRYVFDNIAYPPTANMPDEWWNAAWIGWNYAFYQGAWGWMSGSNWLGFGAFQITPTTNNFAVKII